MPKSIVQLSVFVSSPGGLSPDRGAVETAIEEANKILESEGLILRPFMWEKDTVPQKSNGYSQTVLNKKIIEGTDILVLLMHSRVGTSTPASVSGTVEEFEVAHTEINSNLKKIEVLIYFSISPISPLSDLDQLRLVQEFRKRVQSLGYLSKDYENISDFGISLISALVDRARSFLDSSEERTSIVPGKFTRIEEVEECGLDEELGFLDYEEISARKISESVKLLGDIGEEIRNVSDFSENYAGKLDAINAISAAGGVVDRKSVIDEFSDKLIDHSARLESLTSEIEAALSEGASAALNMVQEWPIETPEARVSVQAFADAIEQATQQIEISMKPIGGIAVAMESWPGLTKKLKISRRKAVNAHSRLFSVMGRNQQILEDTHKIAVSRLGGG